MLLFLVIPCLVVAVQSCMEWILLKKMAYEQCKFCIICIILEYMLIIICFSFSRCYKQLPLFCLLQYRSIGKMLFKKTRWVQLWNLYSRYHFPYWGSIRQIQNRIKKYLHFNDIDNLEFPWFWEISFVTKLSWNLI